MLISALIAIFESTASVLPSALSESTSCVRTGYKEDTNGISDVAFDEFGRVCQHGRIRTNIAKYLVQNCKCDVNSISKSHRTPFHYAARNGHMNVIRYLIENKANIVCYDENGNTPLHFAARQNQLEVVIFLTRKVQRYPFERNYYQQSPLHLALLRHSNNNISSLLNCNHV